MNVMHIEINFRKQHFRINYSDWEAFVSQHQRYSEAQKHRELRERLVRAGIARPQQEVIPDALPISIQQSGGPMENVLFRLGPLKTGCWLSLVCATQASRGVYVRGVELELPFPDFHFDWLLDPGRSCPIYTFPLGAGPDLPRDTLINHKIPGVLRGERPWEGFLAGTCNRSLPKEVGAELAVKVVLYDDLGRTATSDIAVIVNHTTWASAGKPKKRPTLGLFEPLEGEAFRPPAWARTQEDYVPKSERNPKLK